jgi:hypothetical protein
MNPELRWSVYPNGGYLRLRIPSEADAIKILVLTRGCGQGFSFTQGGDGIIWAKTLKRSSETMKLLQKAGYADPKQIV